MSSDIRKYPNCAVAHFAQNSASRRQSEGKLATIQREVRRRGLFGQVVLASFWLWQIVMIVWVARYWSDAGGDYATATGAASGNSSSTARLY